MDASTETSTQIPCQICKEKLSLYRCPACHIRTCSLECCLSHKKQTQCNGKRDRTAFVPLHQFTDSTLSSDFHFLEDVLAGTDRGKRLIKNLVGSTPLPKGSCGSRGNKRQRIHNTPNRHNNHNDDGGSRGGEGSELQLHPLSELRNDFDVFQNESVAQVSSTTDPLNDQDPKKSTTACTLLQDMESDVPKNNNAGHVHALETQKSTWPLHGLKDLKPQPGYPKHKQVLVQRAKERNIRLLLMPQGMQRHLSNKSTRYDVKKDMIYWKVEFIFHVISAIKNHNDNDRHPLKSTITLERIPENQSLHDRLCQEFEKLMSHSAPIETRCVLRHFRQSTILNAIQTDVLTIMKRIPCASSQPKYIRVDLKQTLRDMLRGTAVIEFPTIEVVLPEDKQYFPLMIQEL